MDEVKEFFEGLLDYKSWPPRWQCGYWSDFHGWLYIISELMVWTAYFLIPLIIINYFIKKKTGIKFRRIYILFASFILLCGSTHFIDALMFWVPMYRLNAVIRLTTGIVSLFTVYHLVQVLPDLFKQRSTEELELEIELRKAAEVNLSAANQGLEAFAYMASHDLQEPLRKINLFTSMLLKANTDKLDDNSKKLADKIVQSSERMQALINDVLALSTISENIDLQEVKLNTVVQNALDDLEVRIMQTGAVVNVSPLPHVMGNASYLTQLFYNLISNSIKFSKEKPEVTITGERLNDMVHIHVADNGIGMAEEDLEKIFNAFSRLHSKAAYEGTGIGLAICKKIVDIHHGTINVTSKLGEGTTFTIGLPAQTVV